MLAENPTLILRCGRLIREKNQKICVFFEKICKKAKKHFDKGIFAVYKWSIAPDFCKNRRGEMFDIVDIERETWTAVSLRSAFADRNTAVSIFVDAPRFATHGTLFRVPIMSGNSSSPCYPQGDI